MPGHTRLGRLDHPDIYQAATLGVTVEHLGATMWTSDPVATVRPASAFPLYLGEGAPLYAAGLAASV